MANLSQDLLIKSYSADRVDLLNFYQLNPQRYPFLLESVAKSDQTAIESTPHASQVNLGQFDILMAFPQETIELNSIEQFESFQTQFRQSFADNKISSLSSQLPFQGGWFCYFSYDYAQLVEPSLQLALNQQALAKMVRIPAAIIQDHSTQTIHVMCEKNFSEYFEVLCHDFENLSNHPITYSEIEIQQRHKEPEQKYLQGVEAIKEYILNGDVFQVNLSRQWQVSLQQADPITLYRALRKDNPARFAAFVDFEDWQIMSSSPERLVRYHDGYVETRPIAGTRKRSPDLAADVALIKELISHPKEIAEHIMLIDLERNDLGRICQPGTVEVNELMVVESYQHVHHIVSNVRGLLRQGFDPLDIIHAVFPGGTITGCPKVRCMEIIAELEQMPRGVYTGSLGYINRDGSLDVNILIRTMVLQQQQLTFRAGAGIVADSVADRELKEAYHKAKGLLNAIEQGLTW